ncbi:restriction endonuclease subunit S [Vibrio navarrensis]
MPYSALEAKEIATLCTVVDCEHKTAPYVEKSDYLVVRTSNVRNGQLFMEDMKYTTVDGYNEWTQRAVPAYGDVLFTREAPAGESCLVPHDKKVCMGQRMVMLRPNKDVTDPIFLSLILNTERTKTDISRLSIGSTVSRINIADIKKLKVASPPLPEQRKIAQILSTWERGIATTEKLIDASKQQKKALMQQLLTGKKRLIDPETGNAFEGEWEDTHLSNITSIKKGKALSAKNLVAGSYPVIAGGKSSPYSHVDFTHENVITVSASGAYAGYVSYHPYKIWASDCSVVTAKPANYLGFIFQWLQLNQIRIYSMQSGGAQPHIYPKDLEVMKLRVPKIEEQQKIASVLTAADKEIELLVAKLAHLKQEKKALMQQLLTGKRRVNVAETEAA